MTHPRPPEIDTFNALLVKMLEQKGDGRAAIGPISDDLRAITGVEESEAALSLFRLLETISKFIEDDVAGSRNPRAGLRLKDRINSLFTPQLLGANYAEYQNNQKQNIEAVVDMMSFLDHLEFDGERFDLARANISSILDRLEKSTAESSELSDANKKLIFAQIALIKRSLIRFSVDGLGPFRESIFTSIGRLTIELKSSDGSQASAIRTVIDDILRAKDVAEIAGGALQLTGPFVAGLLTGPAIG